MFSSPFVRLQNQQSHENSQSLIARKPGAASEISRKAFQDRNVNKLQLDPPKSLNKPKINLFAAITPEVTKVDPTFDYFDKYSFQSIEDTYDNILSKNEQKLSLKAMTNAFKATIGRFNPPTPPPPTCEPIFENFDFVLQLPSPNEELQFNYFEVDEDIPRPTFSDFDY